MKSVLLLLGSFSILFMSSCKDDSCKAGAGGSLTFVLSPKHHVRAIPGCTIKLKFNAKDFPGENGNYEIVTQAGATETSITVTGLKCGDYYFYGVGIDSTLSDADKTVKGGIPYSTKQESGTIELVIPVTEAH
jgi:hypothetical protein